MTATMKTNLNVKGFEAKVLIAEATINEVFATARYALANNSFDELYQNYLDACKALYTTPIDTGLFRAMYVNKVFNS